MLLLAFTLYFIFIDACYSVGDGIDGEICIINHQGL